jgi:hypothetical protein
MAQQTFTLEDLGITKAELLDRLVERYLEDHDLAFQVEERIEAEVRAAMQARANAVSIAAE